MVLAQGFRGFSLQSPGPVVTAGPFAHQEELSLQGRASRRVEGRPWAQEHWAAWPVGALAACHGNHGVTAG